MARLCNFLTYLRNRFGFMRSFEFAFGFSFWHAVMMAVVASVLAFGVYQAVSSVLWTLAQAKAEAETKVAKNATYVKNLEKYLAMCLNETEQYFQIGEETWSCRAKRRS